MPRWRAYSHTLTPREWEVARLIARGKCDRAIAKALGMAYDTERQHVQSIFCKLGKHRRRQGGCEAAVAIPSPFPASNPARTTARLRASMDGRPSSGPRKSGQKLRGSEGGLCKPSDGLRGPGAELCRWSDNLRRPSEELRRSSGGPRRSSEEFRRRWCGLRRPYFDQRAKMGKFSHSPARLRQSGALFTKIEPERSGSNKDPKGDNVTVQSAVEMACRVIIEWTVQGFRIEPLGGLIGSLFGCGGSHPDPDFDSTYENMNMDFRSHLGRKASRWRSRSSPRKSSATRGGWCR
jgi:DNA-binding CsgD family transcriptional regulator